MSDFRADLQVAENAYFDYDKFIIRNSNDIIGGANYLLEFNDTRQSKDNKFNEYLNTNLGLLDEILSVGKLHIFHIICDKIKNLFF